MRFFLFVENSLIVHPKNYETKLEKFVFTMASFINDAFMQHLLKVLLVSLAPLGQCVKIVCQSNRGSYTIILNKISHYKKILKQKIKKRNSISDYNFQHNQILLIQNQVVLQNHLLVSHKKSQFLIRDYLLEGISFLLNGNLPK